MKKIAMIASLMAIVFAFSITTLSAQVVTSEQKVTTEKVSIEKDKDNPSAKAACSDKKASSKACCSDKKASSKGCCSDKKASAKSGCSKTCTSAEKAACKKEGHAHTQTEAAPVPKNN